MSTDGHCSETEDIRTGYIRFSAAAGHGATQSRAGGRRDRALIGVTRGRGGGGGRDMALIGVARACASCLLVSRALRQRAPVTAPDCASFLYSTVVMFYLIRHKEEERFLCLAYLSNYMKNQKKAKTYLWVFFQRMGLSHDFLICIFKLFFFIFM